MREHGRLTAKCFKRTQQEGYSKRFSRLFPQLAPARFKMNALEELARSMGGKDGGDSEIPSGYTYFGQFIDHDITRDAMGDEYPNNLINLPPTQLRSPSLDLDSLYGDELRPVAIKNRAFVLGETAGKPRYPDLLRDSSGRALIGDPRNEDNLIISQLHLRFQEFHNKLLEHLIINDRHTISFEEVRRQVVYHYQWLVLYDYLPRIIQPSVYKSVIEKKRLKLLPNIPGTQGSIPLEFSGAAFRFGHAQVRESYLWNEIWDRQPAMTLLSITGLGKLSDGMQHGSSWLIDWRNFFDGMANSSETVVNRARKISTQLSPMLSKLPHSGKGALAERNLKRGALYELPAAQDVAAITGIKFPSPKKLLKSLSENQREIFQKWGFEHKTPLWFYILLESELAAKINQKKMPIGFGPYLGELGSQIVCEVLYGLILSSEDSIIRDQWKADNSPFMTKIENRTFQLKDIISYAGIVHPKIDE